MTYSVVVVEDGEPAFLVRVGWCTDCLIAFTEVPGELDLEGCVRCGKKAA